MKFDISIREKLVVYYVLLGIVSIFIVGVYSYYNSKEAILNRSFEQLTSIREEKKKSIENFFQDRIREIKLLSNSNEIKEFHSHINQSPINWDKQDSIEANKHIVDFLSEGGYYQSFTVINSKNQVLHCNRIQELQFERNINSMLRNHLEIINAKTIASKSVILTDYLSIENSHMLLLSSPIFRNNSEVIGSLIFAIGEDAVNEIMFEKSTKTGLGETGESYLVGKDLLMRSASRFQDSSILRTIVETVGVGKSLEGESGTRVITDYRDIPVLSSFSELNIPGLEWVILAEIDFTEVMYPVFSIRDQVILITTIISLILIAIAFIISNRITIPLRNLVIATNKISLGEYGHTVPIYTDDEIGELTEAFNSMSVQIKEQTKELVEREKRLNHFYEATKDGIMLHDRGRPVLINQALSDLTGFSLTELMSMRIHQIIKIIDTDRYLSHPNKSFSYETTAYKKNGESFPVEVQENPLEFDGEIISSSVIRNIQERKDAQKALNTERKKRLSSFIDGQENERKRLSRELHDSLGQSLIAIKMRLESISAKKVDKAFETVDVVKAFVNNTIEEVRRMSNNLMPAVLSEFGLITAINNLCTQTKENSKINVIFEHQNVADYLPDKITIYIFRIVQEALNNALKHSGATEINLMLVQEEKNLILLIEDNGKGFDPKNQKSQGNGLYNMRERVNLLQGTIFIMPSLGEGLVINIKIPLKATLDEQD